MDAEYRLDFFKKNGFQRKICPTCKAPFWTQDAQRANCGDPPCAEYQFLGSPVTKKKYNARDMRERFLAFFESKGHTRLARYPVVARWREDIYLTIASIADFQPHVTSGLVPPPANPLTISQPCIRLNDLDSVGRSGRHLTNFEMMAHHAFNSPGTEVYWKEETTAYCHEFMTKALGIKGESFTYKEKPWAGGGNAGPAFEVLTHGLEVATLVFMGLRADPKGGTELYGERYSEMPMRIVDTGYGLERLAWVSSGQPTIYDALYPDLVKDLSKRAGLSGTLEDPTTRAILTELPKISSIMDVDTPGKLTLARNEVLARLRARGLTCDMETLVAVTGPLERIYAAIDHSRCLAFMFGDGIVPSNVKAGYLARLVLRRTIRLLDELAIDLSLADLVDQQLAGLSIDYPEMKRHRDRVREVCELEIQRYRETVDKGRRLARREAEKLGKGAALPTARLIDFYDAHGLSPEIVKEAAKEVGVEVDVPDNFYTLVAAKHSKAAPEETAAAAEKAYPGVKPTRLLFYEQPSLKEFEAVVLYAKENEVLLDQTAFYPEGGGQPADQGFLLTEDRTVSVLDVQKHGDIVVHVVDGKLARGEKVRGRLDGSRRLGLTRSHTATHVVVGSARRVLGDHLWQAGAQKGVESSRIDISHYKRVSDEELREIEQLANLIVMDDIRVETGFHPREEADRKWGFRLYQGGVPPSRDIRVVRIGDFDVQACAGTHTKSTSEVGPIKVLKTERVQDGVERIVFAAGMSAVKHIQERDLILQDASEVFSVPQDQLPKTASRFFDEWKQLRKQVEELQGKLAAAQAENVGKAPARKTPVGPVVLLRLDASATPDSMRTLSTKIAAERPDVVAVVTNPEGGFVVAAGAKSGADAKKVTDRLKTAFGGGGGGSAQMTQGKLAKVTSATTDDEIWAALG
ncbi:MAG: alanine--tRNA ligase [Methanobacteriota archaeon]